MRRIFTNTTLHLVTLLSLSLMVASTSTAAGERMADVAKKMLNNIDQATWISDGKSTHVAYIFFDPNCPYCHSTYLNTRDAVKNNAIEIRWIPVGILTATSYGKAASIMDAKDPLTAFYQNEDHYARGEGGGGIDEALDGTEKTQKALKMNAELLQLTGFNALPSILFHDKNNQAVIIQGAPSPEKLKIIVQNIK